MAGDTPNFQTKQAMVLHALRSEIMGGQLQPGTRLVIDDIAKRMNVSPIPVREALQVLQSERLVEVRPHIGAVVTDITPEAIQEIFLLLESLEIAVFRLAVERFHPEHLDQLKIYHEGMISAAAQGDEERWIVQNAGFHTAIPTLANLPRAREMIARTGTEWERLRRLRFQGVSRPDSAQAHAEHAQMIQALADRDLPTLETLARDHNRHAYTHYLGQVGQKPESGL